MDLDLEELAAILELLEGATFTEFRLHKGDLDVVVTRGSAGPGSVSPAVATTAMSTSAARPAAAPTAGSRPSVKMAAPVPQAVSPADLEDGEALITTPMLGTFYRSPKPGEPPFVEVGDKVEADAVVGIVEVMKLMSSITADVTGEVTKVFAQNGQLVEADQPLFAVRTAA